MGRVSLSATGFYKTPEVDWDRATGRGHPFFYFAYGAACTEVVIDTLTGEYRVLRVDILHDVGESLNPAIDIGQIEGGFVQGVGWLTTEELVWDEHGRLRDPCALDLQDPHRLGPRPRSSTSRSGASPTRADDLPLEGGGRAAVHARHLGAAWRSPTRSRPAATHYPALDAPATPERVLMGAEDGAPDEPRP